jgi:hypothetical protein
MRRGRLLVTVQSEAVEAQRVDGDQHHLLGVPPRRCALAPREDDAGERDENGNAGDQQNTATHARVTRS